MSETIRANENQNSPSADDLEAKIAQDRIDQTNSPENEDVDEPVRSPKRYPVEDEETEVEEKASEEVVEEEEVEDKKDDEKHKEENEYQERIKRLAIERREIQRSLKAAQEEIARLKGEKPPAPPDEEFQQRVDQAAKLKAEADRFNERCNTVYQQGLKEYSDFQGAINNFGQIGGLPNPMIEAILETDSPTKMIRYLGNNLDEAEHLLTMNPAKMAVNLMKINQKINAPPPAKPQSKAPAPIRPVNGSTKIDPNPEKMPIREFMRMEDERTAKRRRYS